MTTTSATSSSGLGDTTVPNLAFHDGYGIFSLLKVGCSPLGKAKRKATALQDLRGISATPMDKVWLNLSQHERGFRKKIN